MSIESPSQTIQSLEGKLLVASPYFQDPPYRHAVVLMMQHTLRGSCGLVLENNLQASLAQLEQAAIPGNIPKNRLTQETNRLTQEPATLRLFAGCILWPAGQLEHELGMGIWMTTAARLNSTRLTDDLWLSLLTKIGRSVLEDTLHIKGFPQDPSFN